MPTTEDSAGDPTPDPITEQLLCQAWVGAARAGVADDPVGAARRAYRTMLRAVQALFWERHRRRFRVPAAAHAAFWEDFARPEVGLVDAQLHRWLLEAYALCGRDGPVPAPRVTPQPRRPPPWPQSGRGPSSPPRTGTWVCARRFRRRPLPAEPRGARPA